MNRIFCLFFLLVALAAQAQEVDPIARSIRELKADEPDLEILARALPLLAQPEGRTAIRPTILELKPFPGAQLVALLAYPTLDVRLGSLELLEEASGGDFGFNPWLAPNTPDNEGPLALWKNWAGKDLLGMPKRDLLNEEQRNGYLRDLLANDSDKASRARRMLEADGIGAVGFLENFLTSSPTLAAGSRAKVREAQYQIVLSRPLGPQAPATARQLAFGSRDQILTSLSTLRNVGLVSLPILADFIEHRDPLIRETAMDSMLAAGSSEALPVIGPVILAEKDVNVIHGVLRRIKEIPGKESLAIASAFLSHENEDLLVSAIQACLKLSGGGSSDPFSGSSYQMRSEEKPEPPTQLDEAIILALSDPRWRVRTAALEFVAGRKLKAASERCVEMLADPDEFVRYSAIKAAAAVQAKGTVEKLKELFMTNPEMTAPVLGGYAALGEVPDAAMIAKLNEYPADVRLAAVRAAEADPKLAPLILRFATDQDLDVACAALRFLAADDDRVATPEVASALLTALRSGNPQMRAAVLDRLSLPEGEKVNRGRLVQSIEPGEPTALDPLYDAFLGAAGAAEKASEQVAPVEIIAGAQGELITILNQIAATEDADGFRAAMCLARAGNASGTALLASRVPNLSTAQRVTIAERLYSPKGKEALELLRLLVRDPLEEIRSAAAETALSDADDPSFLKMILDELSAPGSLLQPNEVYGYGFESACREGRGPATIRAWAATVLAKESTPDPLRVLALVGLQKGLNSTSAETVLALASKATNPWVRRAAWHCLGSASSSLFTTNLATLAADPSPHVRAVLPEVCGKADSAWHHRFDDIHMKKNSSWDSSRDQRRVGAEARELLQRFATGDPSPEVRFESMFVLLTRGETIDTQAFAALIPTQPAEANASKRIASWMGNNSRRLGAGLGPIVAALDVAQIQPAQMQAIVAKTAPKTDSGAGFASFAGLVASAEAVATAPQQDAAETTSEEVVARDSLKIVYFFKPGCAECAKATQLLDGLLTDFPLMAIERHNLNETRPTIFNQALSSRFAVPSHQHTIAPSIFTQAGFLVREDITPQALGQLLAATMVLPQDDSWSELAAPQVEAAREVVEERFHALTLPVVLLAGLIDGVNPCAFATIIFFLSYLQIARRTPREMLMVGAAFISAVFLAYFAAGLVLHSVLAQLTEHIGGIKKYLDWGFGGLALVAAALSFRDAFKARAGRMDEMTLQLPGMLKDRIRSAVRTGTRARHFVIAAFITGIVISFLELACTGQVYAPIIYSIQQGRLDAVAWLFAYNTAFIIPLVGIFAMAFTGVSNKSLIAFQSKHTFSVKIALGLVFIALAAVILFGSKML
jgi:cytochrome c biogenesis protein CcdA/HEAT repeat protein